MSDYQLPTSLFSHEEKVTVAAIRDITKHDLARTPDAPGVKTAKYLLEVIDRLLADRVNLLDRAKDLEQYQQGVQEAMAKLAEARLAADQSRNPVLDGYGDA